MAAQSSFEFTSVVGGGGCDVIFNITDGGLELIFFVLEGGVLSKFLLDNSSFSAPPPLPDNYNTVPNFICSNLPSNRTSTYRMTPVDCKAGGEA